jgi:hypothetical protein
VSFSELENDTLNQVELNEIKINEHMKIADVPASPFLDMQMSKVSIISGYAIL